MTGALTMAILRTTCCTVLAATIAHFLLKRRVAKSPAIHRLVWCLVLLQGWAYVPLAVAVPARSSRGSSFQREVQPTAPAPFSSRPVDQEGLDVPTIVPDRSTFGVCNVLVLVWFVGMASVIAYSVKQYLSVMRNVPLGREPVEPEWQKQWSQLSRAVGVESKSRFRITDDVGPLCCFVPFFYLILAPERLWRAFQPQQREFVLMHELAHVVRGDMWKSIAIRVLALPQWFNPLAWRAVRAFDAAAEWACDDFVVGDCHFVSLAYSASLLEIAESHFHPIPGSVGARGGILTERVHRLIQPDVMEETNMKRSLIAVMFILLFAAQSIRIADGESVQQRNQSESPQLSDGQNETKSVTSDEARKADLERTGLVPYRVAPPDILQVDVVRLTPKAPDGVEASDTLQQTAGGQRVAGQHIIAADGRLYLGVYGGVPVSGMTTDEVRAVVEEHLSKHFDRPQLSIDVFAYNSKVYYVIVEDADGDQVTRFPANGNDTVWDAVAHLGGPHVLKSKHVWISRPADGKSNDDILLVDWQAIAKGEATSNSTNYQLLPGDRVFVSPRKPGEKNGTAKSPEVFDESSPVLSTSAYALVENPPATQVFMQVDAYRDTQDNLSEYWMGKEGDALIVDANEMAASLRILKKNRCVELIARPRVLFPIGQNATVKWDNFQIDASASLTADAGVLLRTTISCGTYTPSVETNAVLRKGQALLLRARNEPGTYVVLTADARHHVDTK